MAMAEPSPMIVQLPSRPLNLDDVAELAAIDDAHRYELDEGNLLVMPPGDAEHAALTMRIGTWLLTSGSGPDRVLATPGLRIARRSIGRSPDVVLLRMPTAPGIV